MIISRPTLLNAKLSVPKVTDTLERKRLMDRLRKISGKKLALVIAGAGYGKTVLVGQTIAAMKVDTAWCSLDEFEADATVFMRSLIAAIRRHYPDFGTALDRKLSVPISSRRNRELLLLEFLAETFAMFLGRLEFMVVFVSLLNLFRDGHRAVACAVSGKNPPSPV